MVNYTHRRRMRSDAPKLSPSDYDDIMQYCDMKSKPLKDLCKKYRISNTQLYQIWRRVKFERIEWCQSIPPVPSTLSENSNRIENE
ncbi:8731_t:CDS:1, partial [Diversispora eburnea]